MKKRGLAKKGINMQILVIILVSLAMALVVFAIYSRIQGRIFG